MVWYVYIYIYDTHIISYNVYNSVDMAKKP